MTCAEILIIDDTMQELPENFNVGFGQSPSGTFVPGPTSMSQVTIIDNDEPGW